LHEDLIFLPGIKENAFSISFLSSKLFLALPGLLPVDNIPPSERTVPGFSNPPQSSPCQQCTEIGIFFNLFNASSVSILYFAYCSFANCYVFFVLLSIFLL